MKNLMVASVLFLSMGCGGTESDQFEQQSEAKTVSPPSEAECLYNERSCIAWCLYNGGIPGQYRCISDCRWSYLECLGLANPLGPPPIDIGL